MANHPNRTQRSYRVITPTARRGEVVKAGGENAAARRLTGYRDAIARPCRDLGEGYWDAYRPDGMNRLASLDCRFRLD